MLQTEDSEVVGRVVGDALREVVLDADEVLQALRHLPAGDMQVTGVDPDLHPSARRRLLMTAVVGFTGYGNTNNNYTT